MLGIVETEFGFRCPLTPKIDSTSFRTQDGPSAGIAMVTSMLSLALQRPIRNDLAMTGEVSLTGKVLPVGGIKEKIMGGRRSGIKSIILPSANRRDYDEIPDYLKEGLQVHFADDYETVYEVALGGN
jgi:Lon-like ATP-dependent protease